jgi:two-component system, LytTR family, sensor kinase
MSRETKEKTTRIIFHILAWAVVLGFPIYSAIRFRMGSNFLVTYYTFAAINALIFYANYLFLVPLLFFQKKKYRYYMAILALLFFFYFISDIANKQIYSYITKNGNSEQVTGPPVDKQGRIQRPPLRMRPRIIIAVPNAQIIGYVSSSLFMVFLSLGLRVLERQSKFEKMQEELERAKLNAELAFLKNQISPHFFFNTLNNIYSLSTINPEDSRTAILKLSKMMRYLLYDSEDGDTKLSNEIELISNYIDLMKLRLEKNFNLSVKFPDEYEDFRIPPLLFIPFIENAFKHGVSFREDSFIDIFMATSDNTIIFRSFNSISGSAAGTGLESSGIGLNNVRKRLDLLFPGKHDLQLNKTESTFEVLLKIQVTS